MIAYEVDWFNYVLGVYINYEKWDAQSDNYTKKGTQNTCAFTHNYGYYYNFWQVGILWAMPT